MKYRWTYVDLKIPVTLVVNDEALEALVFENETIDETILCTQTPLHQVVYQQLKEYFDGSRQHFDVPLHIDGTPFQQAVYRELLKIEYGEVISYQQLAQRLGCPKAYRAVGNANGKNKIPIIIPCHRVITSNHQLGGYSGGCDIKKLLLEIEGINL